MKVTILIDAHRKSASFERGIHPSDAGDLKAVRTALDRTYQDARAHLDRLIGSSSPLPTDTDSGR